MRHIVLFVLAVMTALTSTNSASAETSNNVTKFGAALYHKLSADSGNLVFSPYNIYSCLAMAYAGSEGNTRAQIAEALALPVDKAKFNAAVVALEAPIEKLRRGDGDFTLSTANASWVKSNYDIQIAYKIILNSFFHSTAFTFAEPSEAVRSVNDWVGEETHNKIQNLLAPGSVTADTRFILASALYMLARWQHPFEKSSTADLPFWTDEKISAPTKFMSKIEHFDYGSTPEMQFVRLPYRGKVSFWVLLPIDRTGLKKIEQSLTTTSLNAVFTGGTETKVEVKLPKIDLSASLELAPALKALGLTDAFSSQADFSGITGSKDLQISDVVHQAKITVDEEGTEAAAAAAITFRALSIAIPDKETPVPFIANHPFLYLVREDTSGVILFIGRYVKT